jgi:sporulation protein YlmC with PRC-barrel domain
LAKVWPGSAKRLSQSAGQKGLGKTRPQIANKSLDRKTQAWNTRPGKEWKAHVYGKAQKTGTPGHAEESYRKTIEAFRGKLPGVGEVERVHLNEGLGKVTGLPIKPNTRPDVTIVTKDGRVHQIEVASKTDKLEDLQARMDAAQKLLPEQMQGITKVFKIGDKL